MRWQVLMIIDVFKCDRGRERGRKREIAREIEEQRQRSRCNWTVSVASRSGAVPGPKGNLTWLNNI